MNQNNPVQNPTEIEAPVPSAQDVRNMMADAAATPEADAFTEKYGGPNTIDFVYYAKKDSERSEEWSVDFDATTSFCMEWRNTPYLVIQGPYTPICFNLRRAYRIGENDAIAFGLKDRVFLPVDSIKFPTEQFQQAQLLIVGQGNPTSGQ